MSARSTSNDTASRASIRDVPAVSSASPTNVCALPGGEPPYRHTIPAINDTASRLQRCPCRQIAVDWQLFAHRAASSCMVGGNLLYIAPVHCPCTLPVLHTRAHLRLSPLTHKSSPFSHKPSPFSQLAHTIWLLCPRHQARPSGPSRKATRTIESGKIARIM